MATIQTPTPTVHHFKEINPGKYASVKHYELDKVLNGPSLLGEKLNIQKDRKFARSMPDYWIKIRKGNKWSRPITGLFKTREENIFKGDSHYKKHLIIARFNENESKVEVFYYPNYFTTDLTALFPLPVL